VWPPRSADLDRSRWKDKKSIARDKAARPGKAQNSLFKTINKEADKDPAIRERVWLPNRNGRLHPRTLFDTQKLYALLSAKAVGTDGASLNLPRRGQTELPKKACAKVAKTLKKRRGPDKRQRTKEIEDSCLKLLDDNALKKQPEKVQALANKVKDEFGLSYFPRTYVYVYANRARDRQSQESSN
jgi:hypothetical protein